LRAPPAYPWYEIPNGEWDELAALASVRETKTAVASNTRYWRGDPNIVGLCGEWVYGLLSGQPMNLSPDIWGQGSEDFPGVDVKASGRARQLGLSIFGRPKAPLYFLVDVDLERHLCQPLGYATREMLEHGTTRNFGTGDRLYVPTTELVSADELLAKYLKHTSDQRSSHV
jgi:hypothetical protein